jgi:hypothetical protein
MVEEIPAFLHYLTTLPPVDWSVDRTGFTPNELNNDTLQVIKDESRSGLYKDMSMRIEQLFLNECELKDEFYAEPISIKERFYARDSKIDAPYIRRVLKSDFGMKPMGVTRFYPFGLGTDERVGRPFLFKRVEFTEKDAPIADTKPVEEVIPF